MNSGHYIVWFVDLAYSVTHMNHALAYWDGMRWLTKERYPFSQEILLADGPVREYKVPVQAHRIPMEDYSD